MLNGPASLHFLLLLSGLAVLGPGGASAQDLAVADRGPRFLRQVSATEPAVEIDMNATPVLRRRVSLTREAMTLGQILGAIRRQTGLKFIYSTDVVPADRAVGLRADSITVAAALTEILLDAGVDVVFYSAREAGLVLRAPPQTGTIAGTVTDGKTGGAIAGATVVIERTSLSATTDNDGHYRIAEVAPGTYHVRARYIGYAPGSASVTVNAVQEATADFALEKSVQKLDEVVTTGTLVPTEVKALPTPVSVITAEDIERQRPRTVTELFRQVVPGAVGWDYPSSPYNTTFSVRGANTLSGVSQMKVFVDGVEAASPSRAPVDPNSIERIEVIRGPQAAAIYGSDAIGGVVQIFTKRGDPNSIRPQVDAEAGLGVVETPYSGHGGVVRQDYKASVHGGAADMSYNFGGGYAHLGDYLPNGEISRQSNPSAYAGIHVSRGILTADVSGRHYSNDSPNVFNPALMETGFVFYSKPNYQPAKLRNQTAGARIEVAPTGWWSSMLTMGIDRLEEDVTQAQARLTTSGDTLLTIFDHSATKTSIGFNTSVKAAFTSVVSASLTAGFDHYNLPDRVFFTSSALNTAGTVGIVPGAFILESRTTTNNTGYFAQTQVGFRDVLFLTGGVRAEQNSGFGDRLGTPVSPRVGFSYVTPIVGATIKLRGSWGKAIRPPSPGQQSAGVGQFGNPGLGPEQQRGWDGGIDAVFGGRGSLSVSYYDQTADDLIQFVQVQTTPLTFQYQNVGRVKNTGLEVEGTLAVGPLQLKAQYGYARSRVEGLGPNYTGNLLVGDQALLTPKHAAGASVTFSPFPTTTVVGGLTYVGSWTYTDFLAQYRCFGGTAPCRPTSRDYLVAYPGFMKLNARISQQITPLVSGFVALDNLTNNQAYEFFNLSTVMGRMTTVGLRIHS